MCTLGRPFRGLGWVLTVVSAVGWLCVGVANAQQNGIDPSDIWFRAYILLQEGEKAEKEGNDVVALSKFNESKPLFDGLAREYPDFHPELVRFRRQQLIGIMDDLRNRMRKRSNPSSNPPVGAQPDPGVGDDFRSLEPTSKEFLPEGAGDGVPLPQWRDDSQVPGNRAGNTQYNQSQPNMIIRPPAGGSPNNGAGNGYQRQAPQNWTSDTYPPSTASPQTGSPVLQIQGQFEKMRAEINTLRERSDYLEKKLVAKEQRYNEVQVQLNEAQNRATDLNRQRELAMAQAAQYSQALESAKATESAKANAETARADREAERARQLEAKVAQLDGLLVEALGALEIASQKNKAMLAELENTQREMEQLRLEKDQIEKERNQLAAIVESSGEDTKAIQQLTEDNRRLREDLTKARKMAEGLAKEKNDKSTEIALLQQKIEKIDAEREKLKEDNLRYEQHIADLQEKLEEFGRQLSEPSAVEVASAVAVASASPEAAAENDLLRTVILKQLRRQNQIKRTKSILLKELDKLGHEARNLAALVEDMAIGTTLTEEERGMIKHPDVQELAAAFGDESVEPRAILVEGTESDGSGEGILEVQNISEELLQLQKVARLDFQEGRYEDAEKNYRKYLEFRPRSVVCLSNLALVKITTKKYEEARALLEKAIALKGDYGLAHYLLGRTFFEEGRFDEALAKLNEGIQYDENNPKAHNCIGVISSQKGFVKRAEKAFVLAIKIDPDYADAHFNLAVLYATRDQPDVNKAEEHYYRAIHLGVPRDAAIENFINTARLNTATVGMR